MSYLLKALKKAEEERASLASVETTASQEHSKNVSTLPFGPVLIIFLMLTATFVKLIFFTDSPQTKSDENESVALIASAKEAHLVSVDKIDDEAAASKTLDYQLAEGEVIITPVSKQETMVRAAPLNEAPKSLAQLSKAELSKIPSLSLQSHMYSSVSEYSSVIINDQSYVEGSYIDSDVLLKKINANGIVLSVGNQLVELPKGITWVSTNHAK